MADGTILAWLAIGLVAGILVPLILPARDPGGIVVTVLIGIAGALLAGFVAQTLGHRLSAWWTHAAALLGAIALLLLYRATIARRA